MRRRRGERIEEEWRTTSGERTMGRRRRGFDSRGLGATWLPRDVGEGWRRREVLRWGEAERATGEGVAWWATGEPAKARRGGGQKRGAATTPRVGEWLLARVSFLSGCSEDKLA